MFPVLVSKILVKNSKSNPLLNSFDLVVFPFPSTFNADKNPVIFAQFVVDVAHKIGAVFVYFVVVGVAATVAAKLFVFATYNFVSTFQAGFVHSFLFFLKLTFVQQGLFYMCQMMVAMPSINSNGFL